jgi:hypothetical protein
MVSVGLTVMVKVMEAPVQSPNVAVTLKVATMGEDPGLVATKDGMVLVPVVPNPRSVSLVHVYVLLADEPEKETASAVSPLQNVRLPFCVTVGAGVLVKTTSSVTVQDKAAPSPATTVSVAVAGLQSEGTEIVAVRVPVCVTGSVTQLPSG